MDTPTARLQRLAARRHRRIAELQSTLPSIPPEHQLQALVELKALRMADMQHRLRHDVVVERRLLLDCAPTTLLEWSRHMPLPNTRAKIGTGITHRHNVPLAVAVMPNVPLDDEQHRAGVLAALTSIHKYVC